MGKIVISENVTLDGVAQDPTGEEGFDRGGWFRHMSDADREAWAELELDEARRAAALLLGRRTEEFFAARWPSRSGEWADLLNGLPKFVVASTPSEPKWGDSTTLEGEVVQAVSALRQELNGDIVVYASARLVRTLIEHDLVDEVRLTVHPAVLGGGQRLFGETSARKPLRLIDTRTVGESLVYLVYQPVRAD